MESQLTSMHQTISESLVNADAELLAAHTAVLAQIALHAPEAFEVKSDVVMKFLLKQVLMRHEGHAVSFCRLISPTRTSNA